MTNCKDLNLKISRDVSYFMLLMLCMIDYKILCPTPSAMALHAHFSLVFEDRSTSIYCFEEFGEFV